MNAETTSLTWFKAVKEAGIQHVYLMVKNSCDINRNSAQRLTQFMNWFEEKKHGLFYVALILTVAGLSFNTILISYSNAKRDAKIEVMENMFGEHTSSFETFCGKLELLEDEVEKKNQAEERLATELKKIHTH